METDPLEKIATVKDALKELEPFLKTFDTLHRQYQDRKNGIEVYGATYPDEAVIQKDGYRYVDLTKPFKVYSYAYVDLVYSKKENKTIEMENTEDVFFIGQLKNLSTSAMMLDSHRDCHRTGWIDYIKEYHERTKEDSLKLVRAERKGRRLLAEILTKRQWRDFVRHGFFFVKAHGRLFEVHGYGGILEVMRKRGPIKYTYCIHGKDERLPNADIMLLQKLYLEGAFDAFLKGANRRYGPWHHKYVKEKDINRMNKVQRYKAVTQIMGEVPGPLISRKNSVGGPWIHTYPRHRRIPPELLIKNLFAYYKIRFIEEGMKDAV